MSRRTKTNGRPIHTNVLQRSRFDIVTLAEEVEARFLQLCHDHIRLKGVELVFPKELDADVMRWREMRVRHKRRDFRNTEDEKRSTRRIAEWTLKVNCELKGQPEKAIEWSD